jgi:hypothetical protein
MVFFNFIETFFFISLGISFLLILLIIYHFKQRIGLLEQKCDTMFEIINNIVKEMNTIKNNQIICNQYNNLSKDKGCFSKPLFCNPTTMTPNNHNQSQSHNEREDVKITEMKNNENDNNNINISIVSQKNEIDVNYINDDDDDDNDDDDDDNDDDDDDDDNDDDYDDDDDDEDDDDEDDKDDGDDKQKNMIYSEEHTNEYLNQEINNIKLINIVNNKDAIEEHIENIIENMIDNINEPNDIINNTSILQIEKIESTEDDNIENNDNFHQNETLKDEISKEVYQKMNIQKLKTLVISKGLCSDPSKMKKQELIKLLENNM